MIFRKIKLKNIRSFKEAEIDLPEGAILLAGDIGSGKTTILLAIEYSLFGLQPGQKGASILSKGEDYGEIYLELEINGENVIIERGLKRSNKSVNQDFAAITINGARFESSVTEIKTKILELLKYPQEFIRKNNLLYRYTIYTPQEEMKQIILEESESRLDVLRHIFGIDKYKRVKENAQKVSAQLRENSRILQFEVAGMESKKAELDTNKKFSQILRSKIVDKDILLKKSLNKRLEKEKEIESLEKLSYQREEYKKGIEKSNILLTAKKENIEDIEKELKSIEKLILSSPSDFNAIKISELQEEIQKKQKEIEKLDNTFLELSSRMYSANNSISEERKNKERVSKMTFCHTCLQNVSEFHKYTISLSYDEKLKDIEKTKDNLTKAIALISADREKEKKELKKIESNLATMEIKKVKQEESKNYLTRKEVLTKNKELLEKDTKILEETITKLKESSLEYSKFDNALRIKREELKRSFEEEKSIEIEFAEIKKELEINERQISSILSELSKGQETKNKLISILDKETWISNYFLDLVNYTEKMILATLRKEFTRIFNKWFSMLTTDAFEVYLDETFSPIIVQGDFELDYEFLSGGERTAVALAYRLALNQLINSVLSKINAQNVVILDEPTDGFSEQQLDKVRDILQELHIKQLLIVSHEPKIESFVDHIIRLKKENGVSKIINAMELVQQDSKI
jgi:exonuclease SbcC